VVPNLLYRARSRSVSSSLAFVNSLSARSNLGLFVFYRWKKFCGVVHAVLFILNFLLRIFVAFFRGCRMFWSSLASWPLRKSTCIPSYSPNRRFRYGGKPIQKTNAR